MHFPFQWWTPWNNGYSQIKLATLWKDSSIAQRSFLLEEEIIFLQFFAFRDVQIFLGFLVSAW